MPTVTEARASYEASVAGSKNSDRFSSNPVRISQENPIDLPEMEVARNTNTPNVHQPDNVLVEEEEEYYDEEWDYDEEDDELEGSKGSRNLKRNHSGSFKSSGKMKNKVGQPKSPAYDSVPNAFGAD